MKICSYMLANGAQSYGFVDGLSVQDVGDEFRQKYPDLRSVLSAQAVAEAGAAATGSAKVEVRELALLPPIANPDKILCIGMTYQTHNRETGRDAPSHPSIFTRYPSSLVGAGQPMIRPVASTWFDF